MHDIVLYGHLSIDKIYTGFNLVESLGCIANTWKALNKVNPNLSVDIEPTEIGEAIVYVDPQSSKRYSKAVLSKQVNQPTIKQSKISAVQYVNALRNTDFIKNLSGIVLADVCTGAEIDYSILDYIDILFVADSEIGNVVDINKVPKSVLLIVHSPTKSYDNCGNNFDLPSEKLLSKVNVLGAGDIYMACYMNAYLNVDIRGHNGAKCLEYAHLTTTQILGESA